MIIVFLFFSSSNLFEEGAEAPVPVVLDDEDEDEDDEDEDEDGVDDEEEEEEEESEPIDKVSSEDTLDYITDFSFGDKSHQVFENNIKNCNFDCSSIHSKFTPNALHPLDLTAPGNLNTPIINDDKIDSESLYLLNNGFFNQQDPKSLNNGTPISKPSKKLVNISDHSKTHTGPATYPKNNHRSNKENLNKLPFFKKRTKKVLRERNNDEENNLLKKQGMLNTPNFNKTRKSIFHLDQGNVPNNTTSKTLGDITNDIKNNENGDGTINELNQDIFRQSTTNLLHKENNNYDTNRGDNKGNMFTVEHLTEENDSNLNDTFDMKLNTKQNKGVYEMCKNDVTDNTILNLDEDNKILEMEKYNKYLLQQNDKLNKQILNLNTELSVIRIIKKNKGMLEKRERLLNERENNLNQLSNDIITAEQELLNSNDNLLDERKEFEEEKESVTKLKFKFDSVIGELEYITTKTKETLEYGGDLEEYQERLKELKAIVWDDARDYIELDNESLNRSNN
eukprot:GAHX01000171.1.p1 GENE.GAHX01000171.1~~GAHX01000171.1.p1  ORF type:complete len:508 (-),score=132.59 GAHX01000171.1:28-1551(-)